MRLSHSVAFAAPLGAVGAALLEEGFLEAHCRATGALEYEVSADGDPGSGGSSRTRRWLPTDRVPDFARRLVGDTLVVVETSQWQPAAGDGERTGTLVMEIEGAPVTLRADLRLSPASGREGARSDPRDDGGTVEQVVGEVTAGVPLFGSRIERAVLPAVLASLDAQAPAMAEWSAR